MKKSNALMLSYMIFLVIAILIVGGIAFAGYKIYQKFTNPQDVMESLEEIGEVIEEEKCRGRRVGATFFTRSKSPYA